MDSALPILVNPWTITVVGGAAVLFVGWLTRKLFRQDKGPVLQPNIAQTPENQNAQNTTVTNNFYPSAPSEGHENPTASSEESDILDLKTKTRILFIEDGTFKQINNLQKSGWQVLQLKDVTNLDAPEIRDSRIIFVDYKEVGKHLSNDEGLGIVKALKERYGASKWIIFYSAHPFLLSVFNKGADSYLAKNSPFIKIEQAIIDGARSLRL